MEFLLESGADVDCLNMFGITPFFLALEGLHKNIGQVTASNNHLHLNQQKYDSVI